MARHIWPISSLRSVSLTSAAPPTDTACNALVTAWIGATIEWLIVKVTPTPKSRAASPTSAMKR